MTNYVKLTDFAAKDALVSGNPAKLIKGTEINDEFNALQNSIATKADLSSPAFQGNPTAATQALGNNSTRLANTAFVQQEIADAEAAINITGGNIAGVSLSNSTITGGTVSGLTSPMAVTDGGTGKTSVTSGAVLVGNGTGALVEISPTTAGNVIKTNGTTFTSSANLDLGTAVSPTSVAFVTFTGIPSWAKRIYVVLNGISTSGSSALHLRLGTSSGLENTGYVNANSEFFNGVSTSSSITSAIAIENSSGNLSASLTRRGIITLINISSNDWVYTSNLGASSGLNFLVTGSKSLGGVLDRVSLTTLNGTDTFDAGTVNIIYE